MAHSININHFCYRTQLTGIVIPHPDVPFVVRDAAFLEESDGNLFALAGGFYDSILLFYDIRCSYRSRNLPHYNNLTTLFFYLFLFVTQLVPVIKIYPIEGE